METDVEIDLEELHYWYVAALLLEHLALTVKHPGVRAVLKVSTLGRHRLPSMFFIDIQFSRIDMRKITDNITHNNNDFSPKVNTFNLNYQSLRKVASGEQVSGRQSNV